MANRSPNRGVDTRSGGGRLSTIASLGRASGVPEDSSRGRHSEEATVLKLLGQPATRAHHSEDEIPVKCVPRRCGLDRGLENR